MSVVEKETKKRPSKGSARTRRHSYPTRSKSAASSNAPAGSGSGLELKIIGSTGAIKENKAFHGFAKQKLQEYKKLLPEDNEDANDNKEARSFRRNMLLEWVRRGGSILQGGSSSDDEGKNDWTHVSIQEAGVPLLHFMSDLLRKERVAGTAPQDHNKNLAPATSSAETTSSPPGVADGSCTDRTQHPPADLTHSLKRSEDESNTQEDEVSARTPPLKKKKITTTEAELDSGATMTTAAGVPAVAAREVVKAPGVVVATAHNPRNNVLGYHEEEDVTPTTNTTSPQQGANSRTTNPPDSLQQCARTTEAPKLVLGATTMTTPTPGVSAVAAVARNNMVAKAPPAVVVTTAQHPRNNAALGNHHEGVTPNTSPQWETRATNPPADPDLQFVMGIGGLDPTPPGNPAFRRFLEDHREHYNGLEPGPDRWRYRVELVEKWREQGGSIVQPSSVGLVPVPTDVAAASCVFDIFRELQTEEEVRTKHRYHPSGRHFDPVREERGVLRDQRHKDRRQAGHVEHHQGHKGHRGNSRLWGLPHPLPQDDEGRGRGQLQHHHEDHQPATVSRPRVDCAGQQAKRKGQDDIDRAGGGGLIAQQEKRRGAEQTNMANSGRRVTVKVEDGSSPGRVAVKVEENSSSTARVVAPVKVEENSSGTATSGPIAAVKSEDGAGAGLTIPRPDDSKERQRLATFILFLQDALLCHADAFLAWLEQAWGVCTLGDLVEALALDDFLGEIVGENRLKRAHLDRFKKRAIDQQMQPCEV